MTELDQLRADQIIWTLEDIAYPLEVYEFFTTDPETKVSNFAIQSDKFHH